MSRRRTPKHELRVGLLLLLAIGVFAYLSVQIGALQGFGNRITVTVVFDDAAGLVKDSAVKVAGVEVGVVRSLDVDFDRAVATLSLRKSAQLRTDIRAQVRARSLLGEKYVALEPLSAEAPLLEDGGRISKTAPSVEIDDLVAALGPVLSRVDPDDVATIVHNLATISDQAAADAPTLLADSKALLDKLNEAAEIAPEVKEQVPALLRDLRRTTGRVDGTVKKADGLVDRADVVMTEVEGAAKELGPAISEARDLLGKVEPGMDDLNRAFEQSDEVVSDLRKVLDNFDEFDVDTVRRLLREEGVLVRLKPTKGDRAPGGNRP